MGYSQKMKPYIIKLKAETKIRTVEELKQLLEHMAEAEKYEICSRIKFAIDNYNELIKKIPKKFL